MNRRFLCQAVALLLGMVCSVTAYAQAGTLDRVFHSKPLATAPITFPGPYGGYMMVHVPLEQVNEFGDTTRTMRAYLVDMNISHEGLFLSPDTLTTTSDALPFVFRLAKDRTIHAKLAPSHTHEELRALDTTLAGSIGYGLLQKYVTAFDFRTNEVRFYPLLTDISVKEKDPRVLALPLIDDAYLTFCHCPYPTIWMDVVAPPLKPGRVQLALQEPLSQVFEEALDDNTKAALATESTPVDSLGHKQKVGLNLGVFKVGGKNIAALSPHRAVDKLPEAFHDLSVTILGTLGNDVLRKFSALIIDPSHQAVYLIK